MRTSVPGRGQTKRGLSAATFGIGGVQQARIKPPFHSVRRGWNVPVALEDRAWPSCCPATSVATRLSTPGRSGNARPDIGNQATEHECTFDLCDQCLETAWEMIRQPFFRGYKQGAPCPRCTLASPNSVSSRLRPGWKAGLPHRPKRPRVPWPRRIIPILRISHPTLRQSGRSGSRIVVRSARRSFDI